MKATFLGIALLLVWLVVRWQSVDIPTWFMGFATGVGISSVATWLIYRRTGQANNG